jgi:hypothetical protein
MKAHVNFAAAVPKRPQSRPAVCFMAALLGLAIAGAPVLAGADDREGANDVTAAHWWWHYYPYIRSTDGVSDDSSAIEDGYRASYYCLDPAGYYPTVTKCGVPWQSIDPNSLPVEPIPAG